MKDTRDQRAEHNPPGLPSGVWNDAHNGGSAVSSTAPRVARPNCTMRANARPGRHYLGSVSDMRAR